MRNPLVVPVKLIGTANDEDSVLFVERHGVFGKRKEAERKLE